MSLSHFQIQNIESKGAEINAQEQRSPLGKILYQFETSIIAIIEVIVQFEGRECSYFFSLKTSPKKGIFQLFF